MADCDNIKKLFDLYIDEEISAEDKNTLFEHLEKCDECKAEFDSIKNIMGVVKNLPEAELPDNFHEELMAKIKTNNRKKFDFRWFGSIAAAVVVLAIGVTKLGDLYSIKNMDNATGAESFALAQEEESIKSEDDFDNALADSGTNDEAAPEMNMMRSADMTAENIDFEYIIEVDNINDTADSIKKCAEDNNVSITENNQDSALCFELSGISSDIFNVIDEVKTYGELSFEMESPRRDIIALSREISLKVTFEEKK